MLLKACPECGAIACTKHGDANVRRPARERCRSSAWRKLRAQVLARDGNRCTRCGSTDQLRAHHTVRGVDELRALITLCHRCHVDEHRTEGGGHPIPASSLDGRPLLLGRESAPRSIKIPGGGSRG